MQQQTEKKKKTPTKQQNKKKSKQQQKATEISLITGVECSSMVVSVHGVMGHWTDPSS